MKATLLVVVFALGVAGLTGCSSSSPTQPPAEANGAPPAKNSGADVGAKKGGRIPVAPK